MNKITSIADFKRAMQIGTVWEATHEFIGKNPTPRKSLGVRRCGHVQSNSFAFETDHDTLSWANWPKKAEFSVEGNTVVIREEGFCELRYTQVS